MSSNSFREMVEKLNQMEASGSKKSVLTEKAKSAPLSMGSANEIYDAPKSISGILNENEQKKNEAAAKKDEKKENPFNYKFSKEHDDIIKKNKEIENAKPKAPAGVMTKEAAAEPVEIMDPDKVTIRRLAELASDGDESELDNNIFILDRLLTTGPRSLNLLQRNIALDMFLQLITAVRSSNIFDAEEGEERVMDQGKEQEEAKKPEDKKEEKLDVIEDTLNDVDDELEEISDESEPKEEKPVTESKKEEKKEEKAPVKKKEKSKVVKKKK